MDGEERVLQEREEEEEEGGREGGVVEDNSLPACTSIYTSLGLVYSPVCRFSILSIHIATHNTYIATRSVKIRIHNEFNQLELEYSILYNLNLNP